MVVPGIITGLFALLNTHAKPTCDKLFNCFFGEDASDSVVRKIEFESEGGWGRSTVSERDQRNNILQKALTMYIGEMCDSKDYRNANISLMAAKEKGDRDDNYDMQYGSTAEQLKAYSPVTVPAKDEWVAVSKDVKFKEALFEDEADNGDKLKISKKNRVFMFSAAKGNDGAKKIDEFINNAFDWYTKTVEAAVDQSRYMYMLIQKETPLVAAEETDSNEGARSYKRYKVRECGQYSAISLCPTSSASPCLSNFNHSKYFVPLLSLSLSLSHSLFAFLLPLFSSSVPSLYPPSFVRSYFSFPTRRPSIPYSFPRRTRC